MNHQVSTHRLIPGCDHLLPFAALRARSVPDAARPGARFREDRSHDAEARQARQARTACAGDNCCRSQHQRLRCRNKPHLDQDPLAAPLRGAGPAVSARLALARPPGARRATAAESTDHQACSGTHCAGSSRFPGAPVSRSRPPCPGRPSGVACDRLPRTWARRPVARDRRLSGRRLGEVRPGRAAWCLGW
jgi:hypothetical protein